MIVSGNLCNEHEMRFNPNGRPVTSFNIATNRRYTTADGERKEETEWFTIVTWSKLAEQCNQFLTKGRLVYVEGRLRMHSWESQDGQRRYRNEIVADKGRFLDKQAVASLPEEKVGESGESGESGERGERGESGESGKSGDNEFKTEDITF